jgi:hypothetical protein
LIELSPKHLELAAFRTGYFDPRFLAVDKNPFRIRAAACADDVALASLRIDCTCVFHALYLARELPVESDLDAHLGTRRLLNDSVGVGCSPNRAFSIVQDFGDDGADQEASEYAASMRGAQPI